jgi:hypothetical protein
MKPKLLRTFLVAVGFLGGVLTCYLAQRVIDAHHERLPLVTGRGMKVGELLDARTCAVSLEPGVRIGVRTGNQRTEATNWYTAKYGVTVDFLEPLHTIPVRQSDQNTK